MHYQSLLQQCKEFKWGDGQSVTVLFVILVVIDAYGHRFEVFTLLSEIHDNVDLVLGMKNVFELDGVIETWELSLEFLNQIHTIIFKAKRK